MVDGGNQPGVHALLQFPHQMHAYRFKLLFESNNTNIFPEGFAREVRSCWMLAQLLPSHRAQCVDKLFNVRLYMRYRLSKLARQKDRMAPAFSSLPSFRSAPSSSPNGKTALAMTGRYYGYSGCRQ